MNSQKFPITDSIEASQLLRHLTDIEVVAEDILAKRREVIDLDRQKNKTREAIRFCLFKVDLKLRPWE